MEKFIPYEKLSKKEKRMAKRQTWGELNPVTRKPENSKAYNRNKARNWKREISRDPIPGFSLAYVTLLPYYEYHMKALTYIEHGKFALIDKPKPVILDPRDAVVRVSLGSICTSDLHIKHGSVPRAVPGITVGHEMVGVVEEVGTAVTTVKPGDRVTVNVETFCGECFFCQHGYVNNCTDPNGGWALGCRIDGGQAEFVRVPYADQGLNKIPASVTDEQALLVGDVLATGFWATRISEITEEDTVLIIGAGPTGLCTLMCVLLKNPKRIIVCEKDPARITFVREHYPEVLVCEPENCKEFTLANSDHGGADVVLEVAGAKDTFRLAWECARPNAIVTVVALYDETQTLPLPEMYGKNLTFKTGGVDGCDCAEILSLIEAGKIDTTPLITHRYKLEDIEEAYHLFEVILPMHCDAGFRKDLQKVYNSHRKEKYEYNVVNFNFTNTVDIFWDVLPYNAFWHTIFYPNLRTKEPQHFRIDDKKGKVYHIHGTLDREMITGVGEPRQLVNTIYQNNEEIISVSVKPAINENCKNGIENRVSELIDRRDVLTDIKREEVVGTSSLLFYLVQTCIFL